MREITHNYYTDVYCLLPQKKDHLLLAVGKNRREISQNDPPPPVTSSENGRKTVTFFKGMKGSGMNLP